MNDFRRCILNKGRLKIICILLAGFLLVSCGSQGGTAEAASGADDSKTSEAQADSKGGGYEAPKFRGASFDADEAEGNDEARIDLSNKDKGYFAVKCSSDARIKLQVLKGEENYVYDIVQDKDQIFPFQLGDGTYTIKIMKNLVDTKYTELYSCTVDVSLKDEFDPFLRPSQYADYDKKSDCVAKASEIAASAEDVHSFITGVYDYVCENIVYDKEKAANIQSGYIPDPDEIMSKGKGICFDYASLAASMLRSHGVPTKIIFGYVGENMDLYHAWNMFYTKESGWVAVEFKVDKGWNRMDLTFSANGEDSEYIGDGSNYLDTFQY